MRLFTAIILFLSFSIVLGFWVGWFVRGGLIGKLKDALGVALMYSTLNFTSEPIIDILGERRAKRLARKSKQKLSAGVRG
jgi:hypothetical protein